MIICNLFGYLHFKLNNLIYRSLIQIFFREINAFVVGTNEYKSVGQKSLWKYNCPRGVEFFPKTVGTTGQGFIYRKGFPYGKLISNQIQEVYKSEEMLKLKEVWNLDSNAVCQNIPKAVQFEWKYFTGMIVIVGIITAVGIVVNMGEHVFVYIYGKNPLIAESHKLSKEREERRKDRALISANRALAKQLNLAGCENIMNHGMFSFHNHNK